MNESAPTDTLESLLKRGLVLKDTLTAVTLRQTNVRDAVGGKTASDDLPNPIELGSLHQQVKAECRSLERAAARQSASKPPSETGESSISSSAQATSDPTTNETDLQTAHVLRSSNLRYLESVWAAACSARHITGFNRRFPFTDAAGHGPKQTALVDIVAEDGALWMKVSTITEKRILFDLARAGWTTGSNSGSSEDGDSIEDGAKVKAVVDGEHRSPLQNETDSPNGSEPESPNGLATATDRLKFQAEGEDSEDSDDDIGEGRSLLKLARHLQAASHRAWADFRHPRVVLVLPNIPKDEAISSHAVGVLRRVRAEGVDVQCGPLDHLSRIYGKNNPSSQPSPDHNTINDLALFDRILPSLRPQLTTDVNLDCTILLALISDVSHLNLAPNPDLHPAINRQITRERDRPLLPIMLYPAMARRRLHTATEAAVRMREIVAAIGTASETRRAELLLGEGDGRIDDPALVWREWAATSVHAVPPDFRLPVTVQPSESSNGDVAVPLTMEGTETSMQSEPASSTGASTAAPLPPHVVATLARLRLSAVNRGVWLLGWRHGWATVTSNRAVARLVKTAAEQTLAEAEKQQHSATASARPDPSRRRRPQQRQRLSGHERDDEGGDGDGNVRPWRPGPLVWALGTARSLVKKERGLRG